MRTNIRAWNKAQVIRKADIDCRINWSIYQLIYLGPWIDHFTSLVVTLPLIIEVPVPIDRNMSGHVCMCLCLYTIFLLDFVSVLIVFCFSIYYIYANIIACRIYFALDVFFLQNQSNVRLHLKTKVVSTNISRHMNRKGHTLRLHEFTRGY
jgi:hypothetical protein